MSQIEQNTTGLEEVIEAIKKLPEKGGGGGDMFKHTYDTDNNGQVDKADDSDRFGGQLPSHYAKAEDLKGYLPTSKVGQPNGAASLDENGKIPESQLPDTEIPPHKHEISDVNGLNAALNDKAKSEHQHTTADIADFAVEMAKKAESNHKHTAADISDFASEMEKKAEAKHQHTTADITDFAAEMSKKADIATVEEAVAGMTLIAQGKCSCYVFNTVEQLDTWLSSTTNTAKLKTGDVFLIRAVNVPDYWWDGDTNSKQILETTKVDLTEIETALSNKADKDHTHSQYLTEHQDLSAYAKRTELPTAPTKLSQLENDKEFMTKNEVQAVLTAFASEYLGGYKWRVGDTPAEGYVTVKKG